MLLRASLPRKAGEGQDWGPWAPTSRIRNASRHAALAADTAIRRKATFGAKPPQNSPCGGVSTRGTDSPGKGGGMCLVGLVAAHDDRLQNTAGANRFCEIREGIGIEVTTGLFRVGSDSGRRDLDHRPA